MNRVLKRILEKIIDQSRKYWSMKLEEALRAYRTSFKTLIGFSPCQQVYDKVCHLLVKLGHKVFWAMKLLTMDSSLAGLEKKYLLMELGEYMFHASKCARLYKEKANYDKEVVTFIQWLFTHFDAPRSVLSDRGTHFQSVFKRVFQLIGIAHRLTNTLYGHISGQV